MSRAASPPRKLPAQQRSRETFGRILDAATRILLADGYEAASTNRIAAEAKLSPGSVYQYFPDKDAIVVAAVERIANRMAEEFIADMPDMRTADPTEAVEATITALLALMERNRELVRVVVEQLPRLGGSSGLLAFEQRISDLSTGYLLGLTGGAEREHVTTTVWMTVHCVEQLTIRYVLDQPPIPRQVFVTELRRLVLGYANRAIRT